MRKVILITILLIISLFSIYNYGSSTTFFVSKDNPDFTIQDLIDNASDGDTIYVENGTYYESIIINKTITLIGAGMYNTTIAGDTKNSTIRIEADYVNVTGFTITSTSIATFLSGITIEVSNNCSIYENIISENADRGIYIGSVPNGGWHTIKDNMISSNGYHGIYTWYSDFDLIERNELFDNSWGIYVLGSVGTVIRDNIIQLSSDGIIVSMSENCTVSQNAIFDNAQNGIRISEVQNVTLTENIICSSGDDGIEIVGSNNNIIAWNDIYNSTWRGITIITTSSNNILYYNSIINNTMQGRDDTDLNQWDFNYPSGGNYWSDYNGFDNNSDGIGDTPYIIDADSKDRYPLMKPVNNTMELFEGWNLISIPLIQNDTNFTAVFRTINNSYSAVQYYDAKLQKWRHYVSTKPDALNTLERINHTIGFWLYANNYMFFRYSGTEVNDKLPIYLYKGWNLIGITEHSDFLLSVNSTIKAPYDFNGETKQWCEVGYGDTLLIKKGYWVYSETDTWWLW